MSDSMRHVWTGTSVSSLFMSEANVNALQQAIRYRVYIETDGRHVISAQSPTELAVIMRSVLLQSGCNDGSDVVRQVRDLNTAVLAFCVPRIVSEVTGYVRYRQDVASMPVPMDRGQLMTTKGTKVLEMKAFI